MATFLSPNVARQSTTSRRRALMLGAAAVAAGAAAPAGIWGADDAELLELASRNAAAIAEIRRLEAAHDTPDEMFEPWDDRIHAMKMRARDLMPTTTIGLHAKAQIIVAHRELIGSSEDGGLPTLAVSLARDVVRVMGRV